MAHYLIFSDDCLKRLRSPVIQKTFQTKSATSGVAHVGGLTPLHRKPKFGDSKLLENVIGEGFGDANKIG